MEPVSAAPEPDRESVSLALTDVALPDLALPDRTVPDEVPVAALGPLGPRVELGFRDGSRASLDPSSEQYRALEDIASVLTRRD